MPPEPNSNTTQQDVILDTCILQYLGSSKGFGTELTSYLDELVSRGFGLTISDVSFYELLSGLSTQKETEGINLLNKFTRYLLEPTVLLAAARLSALYFQQTKIEGRTTGDPSMQDKIIGVTSILTGSLIITANVNDFPRPFFREVEEKLLYYKERNKQQMQVIQLLAPNAPVVEQRFQERPLR